MDRVLHQASGVTVDGASYTNDDAGNRTSKQNLLTGTTENYTYDAIYQLTKVMQGASTTESYSYDRVGNRLSDVLSGNWQYNASNQLTSTPSATFTYDNNGNMLTKSDTNGVTQYAWDYENRLMSVTLPNGGGVVTFSYDPFGRRIEKVTASATTIYAYDGANIVGEYDAAGALSAKYTQGAGIDEPLAMWRGGTVGYYQADGLGSITAVIDGTRTPLATYTYDAFGKRVNVAGQLVNPFQYTGREWDQETGLYYYRARYYEPKLGRLGSEDPFRFAAGQNFYVYANNNSVRYIDPSGRCIIEMYVVPTGEHNDGFLYHSFLNLFDNSGQRAPAPSMQFRGSPGLGDRPVVDSEIGPLNRTSRDQPGDSIYHTVLLSNNCSCASYLSQLNLLVAAINAANVPYGPTTNSNTVTSTAIDAMGLNQPNIPIDVRWRLWGWGNRLLPASAGGRAF